MTDVVLTAIIVSVPPTIAALASWLQGRKNHVLMNSRLDELKAALQKVSHAEGVSDGLKQAQRASKLQSGKIEL